MIVYDNSNQYGIIFQLAGSVLPGCLPVGAFTFSLGMALALLRKFEKTTQFLGEAPAPGPSPLLGQERVITNPVSIQTVAVVIGYLLVVRTNMALGRWMDGISEVQLMLSKWGDAFDALNGFFAGRTATATVEQRERILAFRIRMAHWFSLLSCLAFATLRNDGVIDNLDDVPIKEMFAEPPGGYKETERWKLVPSVTKSFTAGSDVGLLKRIELEEETIQQKKKAEKAAAVSKGLIQGLDLMVLASPTPEEIALLGMANDKVNTVCLWIIQAIVLEIRAGTLDTPAPIASRLFQEISTGMLGFSQAHKVAMVPFPFPFAQLVSLLLCMLYVALPFYIDTFTQNIVLTPLVSFLLPVCYCGLNLIAIELEQPFGTDWNDVDIEVRHEEFLWMLVDVLRLPDSSPVSKKHTVEKKILRGAARDISEHVLASEMVSFAAKHRIESTSSQPSDRAEVIGQRSH